MKKITNRALVFFWISISVILGNPSISQEKSILRNSDFNGEPAEEVNLQTDRDLYLAGESVWFSANCNIRNGFDPSPLSQVLYIELFDHTKKVFLRQKYKLDKGEAEGRLIIPEETPTGYYFIRAYTMYQRNFPPEYYFITGLTVINPEIPQSGIEIDNSIVIVDEGGELIKDSRAKLALKIPYLLMHKTRSAFLTDKTGLILDEIKIHPNGLGLITFIPEYPGEYFLKLILADEDSMMISLPQVKETGLSIMTEQMNEGLEVSITSLRNETNTINQYKLKILDQAFYPKYEFEISLDNPSQNTIIPKEDLPEGLSYLILSDHNGSVLRINPFYFEKEIPEDFPVGLEKSAFTTREKVDMRLEIPKEFEGNIKRMTVSVVKKGTSSGPVTPLSNQVIFNPFLLEPILNKQAERSPELMEQIKSSLILYSPSALDSYHQSMSKPDSGYIYIPEIRDVSISGYLLDGKTLEPIKNIPVYASVLFSDFQFHTTKTQDDGSFVIALNHLTGMHNLYISPDITDGREHDLLIHNDYSTQFRDMNECYPVIDSCRISLIEELYVNHQVSSGFQGDVQAADVEIQKLSSWFGVAMTSINLNDFINLTSFREVINEIVPYVRLKENNGQYRFTVFDDRSQIAYEDPTVLLDHIPVTDINTMVNIHPSLIEKIEVMNQPYLIGNYTIRGLIVITTKTDNFAGIKLPEESAFLNYQTLTNNSSFVPLNFDDQNSKATPVPHFNTTLFWRSFFENDGIPGSLSFFTSDHAAYYDVIIRGYSQHGVKFAGRASFLVTDK